MQVATFGAGCFWGVEAAFRQTAGVLTTAVGYSGGHFDNPTYEDVCSGNTGHAEVVQVEYDGSKVSYHDLLNIFWTIHDPTTMNRQGPDVGSQYRSVIFFQDDYQEKIARESVTLLEESNKFSRPIVTQIEQAKTFYRAEEYHQQYFEKRGIADCKN
jgi:peptide-methionine (S)-S-oxide reductase